MLQTCLASSWFSQPALASIILLIFLNHHMKTSTLEIE